MTCFSASTLPVVSLVLSGHARSRSSHVRTLGDRFYFLRCGCWWRGCCSLSAFFLTDDVLLFFKHYDPKQRTLACVGHLYTPLSTKFGKLNPFFCYLQFVLLLVRSVFICTKQKLFEMQWNYHVIGNYLRVLMCLSIDKEIGKIHVTHMKFSVLKDISIVRPVYFHVFVFEIHSTQLSYWFNCTLTSLLLSSTWVRNRSFSICV